MGNGLRKAASENNRADTDPQQEVLPTTTIPRNEEAPHFCDKRDTDESLPASVANSTFADVLPSDVLVMIFSFIYPQDNHGSLVDDARTFVESHNQMALIHEAIPDWRPFIHQFAMSCSLLFMSEAPFSSRLRILEDSDVDNYGCPMETWGGTGREGFRNIFHAWNKWFDPFPGYARVTFQQGFDLVGYGIKSANDMPGRDPKDWQMNVAPVSEEGPLICIHYVENHTFQKRFETHLFPLDKANSKAPVTISRLKLHWPSLEWMLKGCKKKQRNSNMTTLDNATNTESNLAGRVYFVINACRGHGGKQLSQLYLIAKVA